MNVTVWKTPKDPYLQQSFFTSTNRCQKTYNLSNSKCELQSTKILLALKFIHYTILQYCTIDRLVKLMHIEVHRVELYYINRLM